MNSAEIIEKLAIQTTCQKILLTIREDCKTLQDVESYVQRLLEEASGDAMYALYVNQKIERGLNDIKNGAVYSHAEVREKIKEL